jgi:hypothetical protein
VGALIGLLFFIVGLVIIGFGFSKFSKYKIIQKTPRTKIGDLTGGFVEIHGIIKPEEVIKTPFSEIDCVYCRYEIEEYRIGYDSDGESDDKWVTIAKGERRLPFYGKDNTGEVKIDPIDADFQISSEIKYYQSRGTSAQKNMISRALTSWKKGFEIDLDLDSIGLEHVDTSKSWNVRRLRIGDRKYFEYYLKPGDELFVIGTALSELDATKDYVIKKGFDEPTFIISNQSEIEVISTFKSQLAASTIFGLIAIVVGIIIFILG